MAHWYGTVAAVRDLGRRGIDVWVSSNSPVRQAVWSRYAARRLRAPDELDARSWLRWLLEIGRKNPGAALCATSDDLRFLFAAQEAELRQWFRFAPMPLSTLRELLDKCRLHKQAERAGLKTPLSFFPQDAGEAADMLRNQPGRFLIKQRTQVFSRTRHKGTVISEPARAAEAYESFSARNSFDPAVLEVWPDAHKPLLQQYLPEGSGRIYCIAGFLAPDGGSVTRAAMKVLSHPRYLGVGLLFEDVAPDPILEGNVLQLCRNVGYSGVFQAEFLEIGGEHLLIDFNPRFYNYMAFDQARGLPLAYLDYLHATGAREALAAEIDRARSRPTAATVYCNHVGTWVQLQMERLFRRNKPGELARWRSWRSQAARTIDPVWDDDDLMPGIADILMQLRDLLRHPRAFFRANLPAALLGSADWERVEQMRRHQLQQH